MNIEQQRAIAIARAKVSLAEPADQEDLPIPIFNQARESGLMKGYLDPAAGASQLVRKIMPSSLKSPYSGVMDSLLDKRMKSEEKIYQENRVKQGDEGFDWTRMVGQMASPTTFAGSGLKVPATLGKKMMQSVPVAAGYGAIQPVLGDDFALEKGVQVGTAAIIAPALPLLMAGGKWTSKKIGDVFRSEDAVAFRELADDISALMGGSKEKVMSALKDYKTRITKPNSPQAIAQSIREANKTGVADEYGGWVAKLHKDVSKHPAMGDKLKTTVSQQELNRGKIVSDIAGTDEQLAQRVANRSSNALSNYSKAYEKQIMADPELSVIFSDPFVSKASGVAADTAKSLGVNTKTNLTEYLHIVKVSMDKMLDKNAEKPLDSMGKKAVTQAKGRLVGWLKKKNPLYDEAREAFSKESIPINQMKVGKVVEEALVNVKEGESPVTYLGAMRNAPRTIKKGGESRFKTMGEVYPKQTVKKLKDVGEELLDQQKSNKMAAETGSPMNDLLARETIQAPKVLQREIVIFNHIMNKLAKDKTPEYKKVLGDMLNDPDTLYRALQSTEDALKHKVAKDLLHQATIMGAGQQTSGAVGRVEK